MGELGLGGSNGRADPGSMSQKCLSAAEEAAQQVLNCLHPTLDSEEKRRDIIDYFQRLVKTHLNCEVFPYGSVPLKTYLPDGDIDLTAVNGTNADESLAHDVLALLKREEKNQNAEFKVKDTHYIDAEVKLVKCLVRNTVIDISMNQLGGLSTLCFLEQVDRLVGRNHLFKRSIILIKAWCYYESRILGSHHGLISTYALETLILYIFKLYHSSLCGPLMVLYRFLEYYSDFDWENYSVSLKGPVCKSSLPDLVVKVPESGWTDLMFSDEFLENCKEMFSVSSRALEGNPKPFQLKHLNIVDPLKENNNLGRSVHIGNFYRIRSAFNYGARKLGQVLSLPCDKIGDGIHKLFSNAVSMHGNDIRNSIQHLALEFGDEESSTASMSSHVKSISQDNMHLKSSVNDNDGLQLVSEGWYPPGVNSEHHNAVETYDAITSSSNLSVGSLYHTSHSNYITPLSWNNCYEPDRSSELSAENGNFETGNVVERDLVDSASQKYGFNSWLEDSKEHSEVNDRYQRCIDSSPASYPINLGSSITKAHNVDDISLVSKDVDLTSMGESEAFNPLADLGGDYDSHIRSLLYGQLCQGSLSAVTPSIPFSMKNKKPWDIVCQSMPFWWLQFSQMTLWPVPIEQTNSMAADSAPPAHGFCSEAQKERRSGSNLPHPNGSLAGTHPQWRVRKKVDQTGRHGQSNGSDTTTLVKNKENGRSQHQRRSNPKLPPPNSVGNENKTNDGLNGSWKVEFGSIGNLAEEVLSASADTRSSTLATSLELQGRREATKQERSAEGQPIHLKNDTEFPPL